MKLISEKGVFRFAGYFIPLFLLVVGAFAEEILQDDSSKSYSPYTDQSHLTSVYWGDTHVHTNLSIDANTWGGNKRLSAEDAYRFAQGGIVIAHNGMRVKLHRPLDFIVLADHSEALGVMRSLEAKDPALLALASGQDLLERLKTKRANVNQLRDVAEEMRFEDTYRQSIWNSVAKSADKHNQPGKFTAFIGFEWSSWGQRKGNLHRVVIFADSAERVVTVLPFTRNDSLNPEDLWRYLAEYQQKTGGGVLAIPHNSNLSKGEMFSLQDFSNRLLNLSYAKTRSRWEPLLEVTQIKGDSEAYPLLSLEDEFADFENWNNWTETSNGLGSGKFISEWNEEERQRKQSEYARSALKLGLQQQSGLGINPFKFGIIGSTDSHTSLATADEDNFWGKATIHEPSVKRLITPLWEGGPLAWESAASGYTAIWAEENTRESLFAAMKRKEVYASTGPRMTVRFFGGWDYQSEDAFKPDLAHIGYTKGVPMGGDLTNAPKGKAPQFLIYAVKDPDGANLDRVQVIKGWHDKHGELHEKIYNVALSDGRKENRKGKVKAVGNTVDIKNASYTNSIGDSELSMVWQDPDFDKDELAFYYLRVLEIPTPRWTAYDAKFFGLTDIPDEVPMVTQERAYTSPIWYSPSKRSNDDL